MNAEPVRLACVMVTDIPPVLVSVSERFVLLPTCVLLNARLAGLAESVPAVTPVPESEMLRFGSDPLDVMARLPLAAPLALGLKSTVKDVLWPELNVNGNDNPLRLNPVPLALAAEMVKLDPPEFVSVPLSDLDVPS